MKTDRRLEYTCPKCGKQFPMFMGEEFRGHVTYCQELKDQQPTSEFTKKLRKFVKMYENEVPRRAEITFLEEACGIIDKYGQHLRDCPLSYKFNTAGHKCTCGFESA